jgi:hypothetical protein
MKQVKVTIKATIDEDVYNLYKKRGYSDIHNLDSIKNSFNSAKVESCFVSDFEVESVEVKV